MKRICHDTIYGDRCEKALGHVQAGDDIHQHGEHQWASREYPVPLWRSRPVPAKEMTREPIV
jgi:hypothetical protein